MVGDGLIMDPKVGIGWCVCGGGQDWVTYALSAAWSQAGIYKIVMLIKNLPGVSEGSLRHLQHDFCFTGRETEGQ